jgi:FAD dependent oxidoreductase TIGR03364
MNTRFDYAIAGAGILGLAHAYLLARNNVRVLVLERSPKAMGASVRNFGMLWPIGQPAGELYRLARRSLEIWLDILRDSDIWHNQAGSLHLAYREDEARVLEEFAREANVQGAACSLLTPAQVQHKSPMVKTAGLQTALYSPVETCVDPREVISSLPTWLHRKLGVEFQFGCTVTGFDRPHLWAGGKEWTANHLLVCSGDDLQTLYPEVLQACGLSRCKLQMMRTQPVVGGWHLGPLLAAGLTLRHYQAFAGCPSLPALKKRIAEETPAYDRFGIHVLASQNGRGELVLGDSHEYDEAIDPFDKQEIEDIILGYLRSFLDIPDMRIASRWHGTYVKHPTKPWVKLQPAPGVTVVTGVGGNGMTLSFGLAEQIVKDLFSGDRDADSASGV